MCAVKLLEPFNCTEWPVKEKKDISLNEIK